MVEWTRPSIAEGVLREPGPITGKVTGEAGQTIENLDFELIPVPETPAKDPEDPCFVETPSSLVFAEGNSTEDFDLELDFPCNRSYRLEATVGYSDGNLTDFLGTDPVTSSVNFRVAIPPAQIEGVTATFDEGTREVRLAWTRNAEPDLLGYFIERNPPGPAGFARIGPELLLPDQTTFTDPGIEDEHRYRVTAVRRGPASPLDQIQGEPSRSLQAGPERTASDEIPAPGSTPSATSGGGGGSARRTAPAPSQGRPNSNIFEETLPFDPSQTTIPESTTTGPPEDAAVLAEFDDEAEGDRRATMVPIAGGLALVVGAMHLFLLSKRAGEPEDIPMSPR
jgi:hypothetical protein